VRPQHGWARAAALTNRRSEQTFLPRGQYDLITKIEARAAAVLRRTVAHESLPQRRLARITTMPWENGEDMQILKCALSCCHTPALLTRRRRYGLGQKYDAHHDVGELTSVSGAQLARDGGYRVATSLLYLTDVEEGGETAFPDSEWADPALAAGPWSECAEGVVAARARAGDALVFWSVMPNNEIDPASMHAGCPVIKGEKWTGTKWIHAEPFRWRPPPPPPDVGGCKDKNPTCKAWANSGECKKNAGFMIGDKSSPGMCVKARGGFCAQPLCSALIPRLLPAQACKKCAILE